DLPSFSFFPFPRLSFASFLFSAWHTLYALFWFLPFVLFVSFCQSSFSCNTPL
ncbi:hypothetical protein M513_13512, partial [Trichuris suis]